MKSYEYIYNNQACEIRLQFDFNKNIKYLRVVLDCF